MLLQPLLYLVFIVAGRRNRDSGLGDSHAPTEMLPPARHSSTCHRKGPDQ